MPSIPRSRLQGVAVLAGLVGLSLACNLTPPQPATEIPAEVVAPSPTVVILPTGEAPAATEPAAEAVHFPPPGWLTYSNQMLGYAFDYPPEAELVTAGVTGYPTDELPPGLEPGQYIPTLEAAYPEALCTGIRFGTAYLYVGAPEERGGRYSMPCGISGVGAYDLVSVEEAVTIGGDTLDAAGTQVFSLEDRTFLYEFYFALLNDFRYNYGGDWTQTGTSYEAYLEDKAVIQEVMASWRWLD